MKYNSQTNPAVYDYCAPDLRNPQDEREVFLSGQVFVLRDSDKEGEIYSMARELTPKVRRWPGESSPREDEINQVIKEQGGEGYKWSNAPGDTYSAHSHTYHKWICVIRGSITFGLPIEKKEYSLSAGDQLELPAGTIHNALVGPQGVTCYESHY